MYLIEKNGAFYRDFYSVDNKFIHNQLKISKLNNFD